VIRDEGFMPLDITIAHAQLAGALPGDHTDPFDRLLAAQARLEDLRLVTSDAALLALGASCYW
jgi:PIN domain nuclease of toxin-antitoxin system